MIGSHPTWVAELYSALGLALTRPAPVLMSRDLENPLLATLGRVVHDRPESALAPLFDALWNVLEQESDEPGSLEALQVEHTRLFMGPPRPVVPVYEHAYAESGRPPGDSTILHEYRKRGMDVSSAHRDLPDHIALELEFMAHLRSGESEKAAADFLGRRLATFALRFAQGVREATTSRFYGVVADILTALVKMDCETTMITHGKVRI